jgi:lathosterol oxidase
MEPGSALTTWLQTVAISVGVTIITYWGACGLVHYHFYVRRRAEASVWKLQPKRMPDAKQVRLGLLMGSGNILLGSVIGGSFAAYVVLGGRSALYMDVHAWPMWWLPVSAVVVALMMDGGLYYSHRVLHGRWLFRHIHRHHHKFLAPTIFTMTAVHPIEFLMHQSVLIGCAMLVPVHWAVYVAVVLYTYLIGAIDHSGVRVNWALPLHSSNQFHDDHHVYFHCNFGHHSDLFDRLHGTVRRSDRHYDETTFGGRGAVKGPHGSA